MFYLLLLGDTQGLTCFWDERPCWRVPPSSTGFYNDSGSAFSGMTPNYFVYWENSLSGGLLDLAAESDEWCYLARQGALFQP
ncbi:hypothetical protein F2Q69_00030747 [Brassica cretica]|uniref:Uncharacterized protein n=1 Tax=Brassica cretica TaxID=69181 RepID=A0A8S9RXA4_BRACR|nr:hypothetical protein F2Q69_00030747 [Brassica cretica]